MSHSEPGTAANRRIAALEGLWEQAVRDVLHQGLDVSDAKAIVDLIKDRIAAIRRRGADAGGA